MTADEAFDYIKSKLTDRRGFSRYQEAALRDCLQVLLPKAAGEAVREAPPPNLSADQIAENIVRSHDKLCKGIWDAVTPYCSTVNDPLCEACNALKTAIAKALLACGAAPPLTLSCVECGHTESADGDWYRICGSCRWQLMGHAAPPPSEPAQKEPK